jgi:hypothetical protein
LTAIFGTGTGIPTPPTPPSDDLPADVRGLIEKAQGHFDRAQESLKQGDWAGYGSELAELERTLAELARITEE